MAEISWQNVNAPSNADVFRGMLLAAQGFNDATTGFTKMGETLKGVNQDVMDQSDSAKAFAIKSILANTRNVDEVEKAMPHIQAIAGEMNDLTKGGNIIGDAYKNTALQFGDRTKGQSSAQEYSKALITNPDEIKKAQNISEVFQSTAAKDQETALLNAGIKSKISANDAFNSNYYLPQVLKNTDQTLQTEQAKKDRAAQAESILTPILQQTQIDQDYLKAVEAQKLSGYRTGQTDGYIQQGKIALDNALGKIINAGVVGHHEAAPERAIETINGQVNEGTRNATETSAATSTAQKTISDNEVGAEKTKFEFRSEVGKQRDEAFSQLETHKKGYATTETVAKTLTDLFKTKPEVAQDLIPKFNTAMDEISKDNPQLDTSRISLNKVQEIMGTANLDPSNLGSYMPYATTKDELKGKLIAYLESPKGKEDADLNLQTEMNLKGKAYSASLGYTQVENEFNSRVSDQVAKAVEVDKQQQKENKAKQSQISNIKQMLNDELQQTKKFINSTGNTFLDNKIEEVTTPSDGSKYSEYRDSFLSLFQTPEEYAKQKLTDERNNPKNNRK